MLITGKQLKYDPTTIFWSINKHLFHSHSHSPVFNWIKTITHFSGFLGLFRYAVYERWMQILNKTRTKVSGVNIVIVTSLHVLITLNSELKILPKSIGYLSYQQASIRKNAFLKVFIIKNVSSTDSNISALIAIHQRDAIIPQIGSDSTERLNATQ